MMIEKSSTRNLLKSPDRFQNAILRETQLMGTELRNMLGNTIDQNAFDNTIGFLTNLASIRRTPSKNKAEANEIVRGVYECSKGRTMGVQGVLTDSTALAELPYFVKVIELAKQAHIKSDFRAFYLDWDYDGSDEEKHQGNYDQLLIRWIESGFRGENLHNLSQPSDEHRSFRTLFDGQAAMLERARYPRHPLYRKLSGWIRHYLRQKSSRYANLADRNDPLMYASEFGRQVISDAANRRALCILAAEQKRKMIGEGIWADSLFITTELSPVEVNQYNTVAPFLASPDAKKDKVRLPIINLDTKASLN